MKLSDDELAARINRICTEPDGLIELHPDDARLIACSVLANTILATEWHPEQATQALVATLLTTMAARPRLRKVRN